MREDGRTPWADVVMLGEARFGILEGGPFDGRCYPLLDGTPEVLEVPGPRGAVQSVRYVLREGRYRFVGDVRIARSAA